MNWHYNTQNGSQGTCGENEISALIANGTIQRHTMIWRNGMSTWEPADKILAANFSSAPPPLPSSALTSQRSHDIDFEIIGEGCQIIEVELDPSETVIAEAGAMNYMEEGIAYETKMGDGSSPDNGFMGKLMAVGKRALTGESLFMTHFTNRGHGKKKVAFAAPYPGTILPIELAQYGGTLTCQKDSFLCAALGTKVDLAFNKKLGAGFFGGEGFILQRLTGDGKAFIHAGGTLVKKELKNETLFVDTGCLVAFTSNISYDIQRAGNLKSMVFGGEGLFLATLRGTGTVWLQSLPFGRMAARIVGAGGGGTEQGGMLSGLSNLLGE